MDSILRSVEKRSMAFNREKFKRLVHYVIWRAGERDWFGAGELNKVLWFADTEAFAHTGTPITGATYTRQQFGPVPNAIMPICEELVKDGSIRVVRERRTDRFTALTKPDMRVLTDAEIAIVDWWIDHIATYETAASISAKSHDFPWQIANLGEPLPMTASLAVRIREPKPDELTLAREAAARLGLT